MDTTTDHFTPLALRVRGNQVSDTMLMIQYLREQDEKRRQEEGNRRVDEQERRIKEQEQQDERWMKLFELSKQGSGSIVDTDPMISRLSIKPTQQIPLFRQMKHKEDIETCFSAFESHMINYSVSSGSWAKYLSPSLYLCKDASGRQE